MKKKILTSLVLTLVLFANNGLNAQELLLLEKFAYADDIQLIPNAEAGSDNSSNTTTGWWTLNNGRSERNSNFSIWPANLYYEGYTIADDETNSLAFTDVAGQHVYKIFTQNNDLKPYTGPRTMFASFLLNIPLGNATSSDLTKNQEFFFALKAEAGGKDYNYYGRIFMKSDGNTFQLALAKYSNPTGNTLQWTTNSYDNGTTYLIVMKYELGGLNGTNRDEEVEAGYDDKITLYVNPKLGTFPPTMFTLTYSKPKEGDAYRYSGSNILIGGLSGVYLRAPEAKGFIADYLMDDIRVADSWAGLFLKDAVGLNTQTVNSFNAYVNKTKEELVIETAESGISNFTIMSINGNVLKTGSINESRTTINIENLSKGVYLISLKDNSDIHTLKFLKP